MQNTQLKIILILLYKYMKKFYVNILAYNGIICQCIASGGHFTFLEYIDKLLLLEYNVLCDTNMRFKYVFSLFVKRKIHWKRNLCR